MDTDVASLSTIELNHLINSLVVPRPIAWVTSHSAAGVRNLAPFSFFNVASYAPPIVMISFSGPKHTLANIVETGEWVLNVVSAELAQSMVQSSADYPSEIDEISTLGLDTTRSNIVGVARLKDALAGIECRLHSTHKIGGSTLAFGEVVAFHVEDNVLEDGRVCLDRLRPVGRLGGNGYCVANDDLSFTKPTLPG